MPVGYGFYRDLFGNRTAGREGLVIELIDPVFAPDLVRPVHREFPAEGAGQLCHQHFNDARIPFDKLGIIRRDKILRTLFECEL